MAEEFDALMLLSRLPSVVLQKYTQVTHYWLQTEATAEMPLTLGIRRQLWDRLGSYGIALAVERIVLGTRTKEELGRELFAHTGLSSLVQFITEHFGRRATAVKAVRVIDAIRAACVADRQRDDVKLRPGMLRTVAEIDASFEALQLRNPAIADLRLLRLREDADPVLNEAQAEEVSRLAGEVGTTIAARLGLPPQSQPEKMKETAMSGARRWREFGSRPTAGPKQRTFAQEMQSGYERLLDRL